MRRFQALLLAAGLAAAPASAAAGPSPTPPARPGSVEILTGSTSRGRLGVMVMSLTPELRKHLGAPEDRGVLVARVEAGTPAVVAGIAVGDVLVEVGGRRVASATDVVTELAGVANGKPVRVELIRDGKRMSVRATLTDDASPAAIGPTTSGSGIRWLDELLKPFRDRGSNQAAFVR